MTDVDCLGSIYGNSGAVVIKSPVRDNLPQFTNAVIKALNDKSFADGVIEKCRTFASNYTWTKIAQQMAQLIKDKKNG